ncbi:hypothetical protein GALMADRAFT_248678 [Galerina marginata CBS 339.88]|uniref:CBM1 domain-containing protein n=1 Tax=Galerina marginata (strain CBS 339.88) TaxID=685588 RepID=A0A067SY82_GALM3|nr:hypothetical protein GALMADRAFT_248678 [Galerina marginata CBS 339.88]
MNLVLAITLLGFFLFEVSAQSGAYGQCGGQNWTGATSCVAGYTCTYSNPYYSQCLPGTATTTSPTTTKPSSTSTSTTTKPTTTSTSTTTKSTTTTATTTSTGATPTGSQIRTVQAPVFHFYLQNSGGVPLLGPEASAGLFTIGGTISLNQADGSKLYLNLNTTGTASYQALTFGKTATTTDWGLEGDTIITTAPRQLNFIACATSSSTFYSIYLQNGNDMPAGQSCTLQTIHLHVPCLC